MIDPSAVFGIVLWFLVLALLLFGAYRTDERNRNH